MKISRIAFIFFIFTSFSNKCAEIGFISSSSDFYNVHRTFILAISKGNFTIADEILKEHPEFAYKPFETPRDGLYTPLMFILNKDVKNKLQSIYYLLKHEAHKTINFVNVYQTQHLTYRTTALSQFLKEQELNSEKSFEILKLLLTAGADINITNSIIHFIDNLNDHTLNIEKYINEYTYNILLLLFLNSDVLVDLSLRSNFMLLLSACSDQNETVRKIIFLLENWNTFGQPYKNYLNDYINKSKRALKEKLATIQTSERFAIPNELVNLTSEFYEPNILEVPVGAMNFEEFVSQQKKEEQL